MVLIGFLLLCFFVATCFFATLAAFHQERWQRWAALLFSLLHLWMSSLLVMDVLHRPSPELTYLWAGMALFLAVRSAGEMVGRRRRFALFSGLGLIAILALIHAPYRRHGLCLTEDLPGATARVREFSLVSCDDPSVVFDRVQAEYGNLRFDWLEPLRFRLFTNSIECYVDTACYGSDERYLISREGDSWRFRLISSDKFVSPPPRD